MDLSKNDTAKYSSMTRENFLGFGCSATTLLKDQFKINTFDVNQYIKRIENQKLATALTLKFSLLAGLVYRENDDYVMTVKGSYYFHYFEQFYTLSYIDQMWNLMRNDAFPEKLII